MKVTLLTLVLATLSYAHPAPQASTSEPVPLPSITDDPSSSIQPSTSELVPLPSFSNDPSSSLPISPSSTSSLVPEPSSSSIIDDPEDINPANPSWSELQPDSVIITPQGNFSIQTRLTGFDGCEDKKPGENRKALINQAFTDALRIVGSVGNPTYILGRKDSHEVKPQEVYDYWGKEENWSGNIFTVAGNYKRAQATGDQGWVGDWWYGRYYSITCNDPLKRCRNGLRAYQDDPNTQENPSSYHRINLCDVGNSFFSARSLDEKIQSVRDGMSPSDNVESMRSRGSIFLHEMFHTKANSIGRDNNGGISSPKAIDVKPKDLEDDKAYGAERSKWLAKRRTLEKSKLVFINVDNYLYFALSRFMMQIFNVPYPQEPKAGWTKGVAIAGEEGQEPVYDLGNNDIEEDVATTDEGLTDEELYAGKPAEDPANGN